MGIIKWYRERIKGVNGFKYMPEPWFYVKRQKHHCPLCKGDVKLIEKNRVVNSESPEAKNYDFRLPSGDTMGYTFGNIRFIWRVFYCEACDEETTIQEMKQYEMKQYKLNRQKD